MSANLSGRGSWLLPGLRVRVAVTEEVTLPFRTQRSAAEKRRANSRRSSLFQPSEQQQSDYVAAYVKGHRQQRTRSILQRSSGRTKGVGSPTAKGIARSRANKGWDAAQRRDISTSLRSAQYQSRRPQTRIPKNKAAKQSRVVRAPGTKWQVSRAELKKRAATAARRRNVY